MVLKEERGRGEHEREGRREGDIRWKKKKKEEKKRRRRRVNQEMKERKRRSRK